MSPDNVPAFTGELLSRRCPLSTEFQLVTLHPNAYPALIPLDVASSDLGLIGLNHNFRQIHLMRLSMYERSTSRECTSTGLVIAAGRGGGKLLPAARRMADPLLSRPCVDGDISSIW
jgi:hypothetical protein